MQNGNLKLFPKQRYICVVKWWEGVIMNELWDHFNAIFGQCCLFGFVLVGCLLLIMTGWSCSLLCPQWPMALWLSEFPCQSFNHPYHPLSAEAKIWHPFLSLMTHGHDDILLSTFYRQTGNVDPSRNKWICSTKLQGFTAEYFVPLLPVRLKCLKLILLMIGVLGVK